MNSLLKSTVLAVSMCAAFQASAARMYQWVDPESNTPQLSGTPPTWYRSAEGGPRVVVYERGVVVDDTGVTVPEGDREQLRQTAFLQAEQDREAAREKLLQAAQLKAALGKQKSGDDEEVLEEISVPDLPQEIVPDEIANDEPTPEQLKALIEQWERSRSESARRLVDGGSVPPPPPPPKTQ